MLLEPLVFYQDGARPGGLALQKGGRRGKMKGESVVDRGSMNIYRHIIYNLKNQPAGGSTARHKMEEKHIANVWDATICCARNINIEY